VADHPNCTAIKEFLAQVPAAGSPTVVHTLKWKGKPVANGYTASWSDATQKLGFTVICYDGSTAGVFLALPEMISTSADAGHFGNLVQKLIS
jgi:hypothetical protein